MVSVRVLDIESQDPEPAYSSIRSIEHEGDSTESWPLEEARKTLGAYADALALDQQVSAERARTMLGWKPRASGILEDLRLGSYLS